jgi:hypothetical protein
MAELLHATFREFGRSGASYTRSEVLARIPGQSEGPEIHSQDFALTRIGDTAALLTYRSAHVALGAEPHHHSLRASLWKREGGCWQIMFHQGTPTDPFALDFTEP